MKPKKSIRVIAKIKKISKSKFPPITEDEIEVEIDPPGSFRLTQAQLDEVAGIKRYGPMKRRCPHCGGRGFID